jgi:hypothetical protein
LVGIWDLVVPWDLGFGIWDFRPLLCGQSAQRR